MNKLSKLTALLLAIVLALGVPMQVMAESEEIETKTEYYEVADLILQKMIMGYETYGEYWDMASLIAEEDFAEFYYGLSEEDQIAMAEYMEAKFWASLIGYSNVAPIPEYVEVTHSASTFSVQSRNGDVATVAETDNGLYTNKTVSSTPDANGYYTITLENYATGTVTTTTTTKTAPVDIVIVLDFSSSMLNAFDGSNLGVQGGGNSSYDTDDIKEGSRLLIIQEVVNNFIDSVAAKYKVGESEHRISLITYHKSATVRNDWTPVTVTEDTDNVANLKITLAELAAWCSSNTRTDYGMSKAKDQLATAYSDRQKVVILFTDGVPSSSGSTKFDEGYAEDAVSYANQIKDIANTTIYTVAIYSGASPLNTIYTSASGGDDDTEGNIKKIDAMLHAISSNYPDATATGSNNTLTTTLNTINPLVDKNGNQVVDEGEPSYYLTADSPSSLNNIFQQISSSIQSGSSSVTLDETTIVRDEVTSYFEIPFVYVYEKDENGDYVLDANGQKIPVYETDANGDLVLDENGNKIQQRDYAAAEITIQEAACTGKDDDGNLTFGTATDANYSYEIDGNVLDVTGFDFSDNACMVVNNQPQGKKLIISFKIKTVDGFLGGNDVVTNTTNSGIIEVTKDATTGETKEEMFEAYPVPDVDVELWEIQVIGKHQHIFLSNEADMNALLQSFSLQYTKEGSGETYTVDGIRNDYATLKFTLTETQSKNAMVYTILPGDTAGTWTYTDASGDPITAFDVTPFLTKDAEYTISYNVIPIPKPEGSTEVGVTETSGSLDVEVHVFKPTFTFQDSMEDYLASETAEGYYSRNNYVGDNVNGIYRETWSHTYYDALKVTIYVADDGTLSYKVIAVDADGNPILNDDGTEVSLGSDDAWDIEKETINFTGYGSTANKTYNVTMTGQKPTVAFTYSPVEKTWITNEKVTAVECVKVNVTEVTLTSTNTHQKTVLNDAGAVTGTTTYTTTSVYKEGSDTASATITVNDSGTTSTPTVTGTPHITTKRIECTCSFCNTTDNTVDSTNIHSTSTLEFVVHIKNAYSDLQIIKNGLSVGESAIFTVTGRVPNGTVDGAEKTWTVVLTKTEANTEPSVTITGLLVNSTATVTEDGDWSWRYKETTIATSPVTILPKTDSNYPSKVTVTNSNRTDQWLDDEVAVKNDFSVNGSGTVID